MIVGNRYSRRTLLIRRVAASALLASWVLSCQTYRPVPTPTVDNGSRREYRRLLVVTREGYELELVHAFIRADSVVGFLKGKDLGWLRSETGPRRAFAHDQIVRIESYEYDRGETAKQAATPPPGADMTGIGEVLICALTMLIVCLPPQAPSQVPGPADPTPSPQAPPPPAPAAVDNHPR